MMKVETFILLRRWPILACLGLTTLFLGSFAFQVELNQNPEELVFRDDPEYPFLKQFFEEFGYDEIVVAGYSADNVLEKEHLESIREITHRVSNLRSVDRVLSLANAEDVTSRDGTLEVVPIVGDPLPETHREREALVRRIQGNPNYRDLLLSKDGKSTLFDITLKSDLTGSERENVLKEIEDIFSAHTRGNRFYLGGAPLGRAEMFRLVRRDARTLFPLAVLLLIAFMAFIFRSLTWTLLTLLVIGLSVFWTVGTMYLTGYELNFLSVLIPSILLIIGTSDCVHILCQYQDCLNTCPTRKKSVSETISIMILPCLLTTLTTVVGFSSLAFTRIEPIRIFGLSSAVGIVFAYILSISLLPIGLFSLDRQRGNGLIKPPSFTFTGLLGRIYRFTSFYRFPMLALSLLILSLGAYGTTKLHVETDLANFFGKNSRGVSETLFLEDQFGGLLPLYIVVDSGIQDGLKDPELLKAMDGLSEFLRDQDGVDKVVSISDLVKYANYRFHGSDPSFLRIPETRREVAELLLMAELSDTGDALARFYDDPCSVAPVAIRYRYHDFYRIEKIRSTAKSYLETHFHGFPSVTHHVTGTALMCSNAMFPILRGLKQSLLIALAAIFLLMVILFRSLKLGMISMIPNLIPIAMTLGFMGLANVSLNIATAPVAAIALGLAVDDTIHFLTRFRREFRKNPDYGNSIRSTVRLAGKPILVTSIILASGFLIFLVSDFQPTKNLGVLISLTLLSAVLADLVLLPALLLVLKPLGEQAVAEQEKEKIRKRVISPVSG